MVKLPCTQKRNLKVTIGYSITEKLVLICVDWGKCVYDRRSSTGFYFMLVGGPINWECKTTHNNSIFNGSLRKRFLQGVSKGNMVIRYSIMIDRVHKIALNPIHHNETKHTDTKFHFIWEKYLIVMLYNMCNQIKL